MAPRVRPQCAEYCPVGQWCADARAALPDVVANHDAEIERVMLDMHEVDLRADVAPNEESAEQQSAVAAWRELGDRYIQTFVTSRSRAASSLRLAEVTEHFVAGGCEQGPVLRRVPPVVGATVIGVQCRVVLPEPERSLIATQIQDQAAFERACLAARRADTPDPSPLNYGLYLWAKRPED